MYQIHHFYGTIKADTVIASLTGNVTGDVTVQVDTAGAVDADNVKSYWGTDNDLQPSMMVQTTISMQHLHYTLQVKRIPAT